MCGIFGILLRAGADLSPRQVRAVISDLFRLSESRGMESAGLELYLPDRGQAWTLKASQRATQLLQSAEYSRLVSGPLRTAFSHDGKQPVTHAALLAHSRLVTNGAVELTQNNQPVRWGHATVVHNGIIVNADSLWAERTDLKRYAEVDTEVIAALASDAIDKGRSLAEATRDVFNAIRGAASIAWAHDQRPWTVLATNTGDLHYAADPERGFVVFASERFILEYGLRHLNNTSAGDRDRITWLPPGRAILFHLGELRPQSFSLSGDNHLPTEHPGALPLSEHQTVHEELFAGTPARPATVLHLADESLLRYDETTIRDLRRCSRCILPDTFPFISYDETGVCNFCHGYRPRYLGVDPVAAKLAFIESLRSYRSRDGSPDAIVAFSGGRDSSYGLHLIKKEFGLTPISFTYDWGMVTDLARRNIARICGQLGVPNILVSADIGKKRDNIRRNVAAWLHRPELGLVPLFMAGDKHFFKVANRIKRQTGIRLDLWCANPLENTDFKSGYCGVPPDFAKTSIDALTLGRKIRMSAHYARHFLQNPRYLNSSIPDTLGAFLAYYVEPRRDFFFIYDHFPWREEEVNDTLCREYDWELSPDSNSTWRIGDGTAPFYNYIYVTARGFSEFDTFRSNQIREGMLSREQAMASIVDDNRPRPQSLRWYLETIGLEFNDAIRRINELDTAGLHA